MENNISYFQSFKTSIKIDDSQNNINKRKYWEIKNDVRNVLADKYSEPEQSLETLIQKKIKIAANKYNFSNTNQIEVYVTNFEEKEGSLLLFFDLLIFSFSSFGSCYEAATFITEILETDLKQSLPKFDITSNKSRISSNLISNNNPDLDTNYYDLIVNKANGYFKSVAIGLFFIFFMLVATIYIIRSEIQELKEDNIELNKQLIEHQKSLKDEIKENMNNKTETLLEASRNNKK